MSCFCFDRFLKTCGFHWRKNGMRRDDRTGQDEHGKALEGGETSEREGMMMCVPHSSGGSDPLLRQVRGSSCESLTALVRLVFAAPAYYDCCTILHPT